MPQARRRSGRGQQAAADSQSAFLQCLEKLNEDTFCQILLPKLKADGSAGSLAATCSQLRRLCHNGIERLDMRPLLKNCAPKAAEQWTQGLQEHFPNCSSVQLYVQNNETPLCFHRLRGGLPACTTMQAPWCLYSDAAPCALVLPLASSRLPSLAGITLAAEGAPLADMLPMAVLLLSLRTQLTGLQSLSLELSQSWGKAGLAWMELASMTQLTMLSITSTYKDGSLCSKADFLQLSSLCNLQDLQVELGVSHQTEHPVCFELASHLTALTALKLHVCTADGFSSIGNCTNLQALVLPDVQGVVALELRAADWEVVGKLTRLTHLQLWPVVQRTDCVACQSALQQLTELWEVNADAWAPQVLLGLQGLSHLTTIGGVGCQVWAVQSLSHAHKYRSSLTAMVIYPAVHFPSCCASLCTRASHPALWLRWASTAACWKLFVQRISRPSDTPWIRMTHLQSVSQL